MGKALWVVGTILTASAFNWECESDEERQAALQKSLDVRASPFELRVPQGTTAITTVGVQRKNFAGTITLSTVGELPAGVTVEFDPATLAPGVTESIARVTVAANAPVQYVAEPERQLIKYRAVGPDNIAKEESFWVRPVASSIAGFTVALTPPAVSMEPDESREALLMIARQGNYTGKISIAFGPMPGYSATATPVANVPDTYLVKATAVGPYIFGGSRSVPIEVSGEGMAKQTVSLGVTIEKPHFNPLTLHNLEAVAGSQDTAMVLLRRSIGMKGAIQLVVDSGAPPNSTITFNPNPALDDVSLMTVKVPVDATPKLYLLWVRGIPTEASGGEGQTFKVGLTVKPAPAVGSYTMSPPNMNVVAGANTSSIFNLTRSGGFTGPVTVGFSSVTGGSLPAGMSLSLDDNPLSGAFTVIRLNTTAATPVGSHVLRATGRSALFGEVVTNFTVTVTAGGAPPSAVTRMVIEPGDAEITSPATLQYAVNLYNANGTVIVPESGGAIEWSSSVPSTAIINASGLATGTTGGRTTTITATYKRDGVKVMDVSTPLFVYTPGSAGHYGSARMSTQGNVRTLQPGESVMFQIIVRNPDGSQVTAGVTPVVSSSDSTVVSVNRITPPMGQSGFFYDMTAAFNAAIGRIVRIRYDVPGAGGELSITVKQP
ncbi:MAG: hypothetical protein ACO1Q7_11985 [Gemmatimonas sp.]